MTIGIRWAAIASALPIVGITLAATAWAGWYSQDGRSELARLGQRATLSASTTEALTGLSQEVIALHGLGALTRPVPPSLRPYVRSAGVVNRAQPGGAAEQLDRSDRIGARALEHLSGAGQSLRPGTRRALAPLTAADRTRAVAGRAPRGVSTGDYADAVTDLQAVFASAPGRTQDAVDRLVEVGASPPPWRDPAFLGALVGVWSLAIIAAAAIGRLVARALRRARDERDAEHRRADELVRRNERLLELGDASRRVSARTDLRGVSDAVAAEAAALLGAGVAVVYLVEGPEAVPAGVAGALSPAAIAADAGVLGRALDTGAPARGVADSDPALPGLSPVASLAAPLIAGRQVIGAIVVGREAEQLLDDDDALALRLIALTAATAIEGARARDSATTLALTDPLTGLGNRRRLDEDLARECGPGGRRPVGFVMIDVDHFKAFNDAHGHMAGDDVLRAVAGITASCVREGDVVYRFGGEELCILLPGAADDEALAVAERVRAGVAARAFPGGETQPGGRVTVSAGVARADDPEAAALVAAADAALYRAKREGRDRVVTAG